MVLLSRSLIEKAIVDQNEKTQHKSHYNDEFTAEQDKRMMTAYNSFIRFNVLKHKKSQVLEDYVFSTIGKHLCENPTISYESFKIMSSMAPEKARRYFSAKNFLLFPKTSSLAIESEDFVKFVERSIEIEQTILSLMEFVPMGEPYCTDISQQELDKYILRLVPEIDVGHRLHESFLEFYVYTACQKFMFFLDPRKTNTISIKKLAHSSVMEELLFLRRLSNNYHSQLESESRGLEEGDPVAVDLVNELVMEFDSHVSANVALLVINYAKCSLNLIS